MQSTYDDAGTPSGRGKRFAIVVSEWHKEHLMHMVDEARDVFARKGVAHVDVVWVPGTHELPVVCKALAESRRFAALLAFGIVVRGETRHFEIVADGASHGLMQVMVQTGVPIMNEIIAADSMQPVLSRTKPGPANKGREAAIAALKTVHTLAQCASL